MTDPLSARVLVSFYAGKLEDKETVIPALNGIVPLSSLPTFTASDAADISKAYDFYVPHLSLH